VAGGGGEVADEMSLTIGSLFSGIGGLELGLEMAGLGPVLWQVENDGLCRVILKKHWSDAKRFDDVKERREYPYVDVICGGFPCQDVSAAGLGKGIKKGTRSGLWLEFARIVGEVRPRWVVVENVASGKKRWLPKVRQDLHLLGYDSAAVAISAADVGAPHLRRRIFVIACQYAADANSVSLWQQHGRRSGPGGQRKTLATEHGSEGPVADADGERQSQSKEIESEERRWAGHSSGRADAAHTHVARLEEWCLELARQELTAAERSRASQHAWSVEPDVGRVVDGTAPRLDRMVDTRRLMQLGNAVVPQCLEVVGRMIVEMETLE
jgi:DNA (cytosine-5)-methyltransferase 1